MKRRRDEPLAEPGNRTLRDTDPLSEGTLGDAVTREVMMELHGHMMREAHLNVNSDDVHHAFADALKSLQDAGMSIVRLRKAKGLSQRDLAEMTGYNQSTIQRAEKLVPGIRLEVYQAIADALGATLADLFASERSAEETLLIIAFRSFDDPSKQRLIDLVAGAKDQPSKPQK